MPAFSRSFPLPTLAALVELEKRLGVSLPSDYREFLSRTNGCDLATDHRFHVPDRGDVRLSALYCVRPERVALDLEYEQGQASMWEPLPPGDLAIGADPGGNTLLLSTLGEDAGCVWFWDRVGLWIREDGRNVFAVAPSFDQFFQSLRAA